jgi:hypothetical protein
MPKRKPQSKPKKDRDADAKVWANPDMQALDGVLRSVLKVPKAELEKRLAREKASKPKPA